MKGRRKKREKKGGRGKKGGRKKRGDEKKGAPPGIEPTTFRMAGQSSYR